MRVPSSLFFVYLVCFCSPGLGLLKVVMVSFVRTFHYVSFVVPVPPTLVFFCLASSLL